MKNECWQSDSRKQWSGIDFEPGAEVCGGRRRADGHPLHLGKPRQEASSEHERVRNPTFFDYKIPAAPDLPRIRAILVDSYEPTGPMGAKSIAEIGINAPIPTIANAIYDAVGVRLHTTPFTPERVLDALEGIQQDAW